ncbi:MAG: hypothetical protein F4056_07435 [Chloroflexi bacterium]|nr:hypothetical protein [Chloroflexota bacterium]
MGWRGASCRLTIAGLAALLGFLAMLAGAAEGEGHSAPAASIEVRVWQDVLDGRRTYISARPAGGSWRTLGTVRLLLDDGLSPSGHYRYGDIELDVPSRDRPAPVTVDVRVEQDVRDDRRIYIRARVSGQSWDTLGMIRLPLDDGLTPSGRFRYGNIRLDVPLPGQRVVSLAGLAGVNGYRDGVGAQARFGWRAEASIGMTVDHDGSVIVADFRNHAIRRVLPDGTVTTIAGGRPGGTVDGPAETARFDGPSDVAVDGEGSIYVADCWGHRIRKISPDGFVSTIAGGDRPESGPLIRRDGRGTQARFLSPCSIALGPDGHLYIAEQTRIRRLSPSGWVSTFAGQAGQGYRDGPRADAQFARIQDIDVDAEGNLYVVDTNDYVPGEEDTYHTVRKISATGWVSTLFRTSSPRSGGLLATPQGIAVTDDGKVYVSNTGLNQISRVAGRHRLVPVAGTGIAGYLDGPRDVALLHLPGALDIAPSGALVVVDQGDSMVRLVIPPADGSFGAVEQAPGGEASRVDAVLVGPFAGQGAFGRYPYLGIDGFRDGPPGHARFHLPHGIAWDADGGIIVADTANHAIRRISPDGNVRTVVGGNGEGYHDGPRDRAQFSWPRDVAVDAGGVIYVADTGNGLIRRIAPDGTVTTVGDRERVFNWPSELLVDSDGTLLFSEWNRGTILRLSLEGELSTVVNAGNVFMDAFALDDEGTLYYATSKRAATTVWRVDAGGAVSTVLAGRPSIYGGVLSDYLPGLAVAPDGVLYAADWLFGHVVRISPDGEVTILVGRDSFSDSPHFQPAAILITPEGDLLVADSGMSVIWKITLPNEGGE